MKWPKTKRIRSGCPKLTNWLKKRLLPLGTPYLFGSRTNREEKGGDIDLLLLTEKRISFSKLAEIRKDFILKFGGQKLDVLNFTYEEKTPFKQDLPHFLE